MNNSIEHNNHLKENPFSVPDQYFSNLKNEVLRETHPAGKKIISMRHNAMQYAAAAVIALLIAGGWIFYNQAQTAEYEQLAAGVETELYSYDTEMLQYYSETGTESELTNEEDRYLINSGYANEAFLYGND